MIRRFLVLSGLVGAALLATALSVRAGGGGCHHLTEAHSTSITIKHNCFEAGIAFVDVGDTVTWTNLDPHEHNVAAATFGGTGSLSQPFSWTFEQAGIYPYACTLHWGMVGAIVVSDSDERAAAVANPAPPAESATTVGASNGAASTIPAAVVVGAAMGTVVVGVGALLRRIEPSNR